MNRLRSNLSLNKNTTKPNMKTSIAVNQAIVNTFDSQCAIDKEQASFPVAQNVKKKRTALENISNASGANSNANSISSNKDAAKKSRFGTFAGLSGNTAAFKKTATESTKKISKDAQSAKENAHTFALPSKRAAEPKAAQPAAAAAANPQSSKSVETVLANSTNLRHKPSLVQSSQTVAVKAKRPEVAEKRTETAAAEVSVVRRQSSVKATAAAAASTSISLQDEKLISTIEKITRVSGQQLAAEHVFDAEQVTGWDDIDAEDRDEFSASDYVTSIFKYYRERESQFVVDDYLRRHTHLNKLMRLLLIDWMVEVQQQLEFNHEVLYLSVKLIDLYLNSRHIEKEKLQLLGGAAMFVACKFEERMPPIIDDFIFVSDNAYDRNELIKMEIEILKTVRFDIGVPLAYTFLRRYSKCIKADMRFLTLARYILELSLQEYDFAYISDSAKAGAALYLAMKMAANYDRTYKELSPEQQAAQPQIVSTANLSSTEWNATLIHYTDMFLRDFVHLLPAMNNLIKKAPLCKYKTIFKKYSHQVFYEVANIAPLSDDELERLQVDAIEIDNRFARQ